MNAMAAQVPNEAFEDIVFNARICIYVSLAGLVMVLYDHALTFADEVELVWKAPRSIAKFLFLVNRYCVPSMVIGSMHAFSGISHSVFPDTSPQYCRAWVILAIMAGIISLANSNFIVLLRLWVLWERRKRLIAFTFCLFVICQISTIGVVVWACIRSYRSMVYLKQFQTCLFSARVNVAWLWLPGVVFETAVFALALCNALQRPRTENKALTAQFYRDGGVAFTILFALRISNMVISSLAPTSLMMLGAFFIWCSTTLTVSRLVINLRRTSVMCAMDALSDAAQRNCSEVGLTVIRTMEVTCVEGEAKVWRDGAENGYELDDIQ